MGYGFQNENLAYEITEIAKNEARKYINNDGKKVIVDVVNELMPEKSEPNITNEQIPEKVPIDIDIYENGFIAKYEDDSTEEWSWTMNDDMEITQLVNETTGNTINVNWHDHEKP